MAFDVLLDDAVGRLRASIRGYSRAYQPDDVLVITVIGGLGDLHRSEHFDKWAGRRIVRLMYRLEDIEPHLRKSKTALNAAMSNLAQPGQVLRAQIRQIRHMAIAKHGQ